MYKIIIDLAFYFFKGSPKQLSQIYEVETTLLCNKMTKEKVTLFLYTWGD